MDMIVEKSLSNKTYVQYLKDLEMSFMSWKTKVTSCVWDRHKKIACCRSCSSSIPLTSVTDCIHAQVVVEYIDNHGRPDNYKKRKPGTELQFYEWSKVRRA